jgi:hypothetical protein
MKAGPISANTHAMLEPLMAALLIASPWIFGFSSVDEATAIAIIAGVAMLLVGQTTRWRYSLAKVIPLRTHMMADIGLGAVLILSPFVFGFSDDGGATRFMVIVGILEVMTALATRWDPEYEVGRGTGHGHPTPTA